jgi:hypothetical protein
MKKICSKCKEDKDLSLFTKDKNGRLGVHHYCKICNYKQKKDTYNYTKCKNRNTINTYGIDVNDVEKLYVLQNKKCKICDVEYPTVSKHGGLYIDHCHTTGKVRGLLCAKCNVLIGCSNDNVLILKSAIDYLNQLVPKIHEIRDEF